MKIFVILISLLVMSSNAIAKKDKAQRIDFDALDVDGEVRTPDGQYILQKSGVDFLPIYEVKSEMQNEIKKTIFFLR